MLATAALLGAAPVARAQVVAAPAITAADTSAITPAMVAQGRALFHGVGGCHVCHGANLEGTPIAPTLRAHKWKDAANGDFPEILRVITSGVSGTAMVSHPGGISDAQARLLAAYVWSVSRGRAKP
jgi:mono/diheme cytochrome c family protein